ncbi:YcfL family protein [Lentisphaerota bacterium ZTH]|nr:YcfL family protein [Lentisphaerota bacterium]WET05642.1 YcfL family protein [Lentisphaerota bacterium ZTH]
MKMVSFTAICLAAGIALCGCQNTVNSVENKDKVMQPQEVMSKKVSTDRFLRDRLKIIRIDKKVNEAGLLKVQVTALNARTGFFSELWSSLTGGKPYKVLYKFTWLDKDGMVIPTPSMNWLPMSVIPGDEVYFQAVAPNKNCQDFKLSLREYDND